MYNKYPTEVPAMIDPILQTSTRDQLYLKLKAIDPARANGKTRAKREDLIRLITEAETVQMRKANVARAVVPLSALVPPKPVAKKRPSARAEKPVTGGKLMGFHDHPKTATPPRLEGQDLVKTLLDHAGPEAIDRMARVIRGIDIAMQVVRLTSGSLEQVATLLFASSGIAVEESTKVLKGLEAMQKELLKKS